MLGLSKRGLICCSLYLPYDSLTPPPGDRLEKLVPYSKANDIPVVIGYDGNSHHVACIWQEIVNWRVSKEVSLSDHRIIRLRMSADPKVLHKYRNPLSTDWDCYKRELVFGFGDWGGDILTEDDIEKSFNMLQSKIIAAYEKVFSLRRAWLNQSTPYCSSDPAVLLMVARRA
jgi:hypothetical protein